MRRTQYAAQDVTAAAGCADRAHRLLSMAADPYPEEMVPQDRQDPQDPTNDPLAQGRRPSDSEQLVGETAASAPLTGAPGVQPSEATGRQADGAGDETRDDAPPGRVPTDEASDREAELGHS